MQGGAGFVDAEVFEGKEADGHAFEQIDVEGAYNVQPAFGLGAGAAHDEEVAQAIDAQDGSVVRHGAQDGGHFLRSDVLQRDDDGPVARGHGGAAIGNAHGCAQAAQGIDAAYVEYAPGVAHHGQAVGLQGNFHEVDGLVRGDGFFGGQGDVAANGGVQDVVHVQDVAQNGAHKLGDGNIFEVEGDGLPGFSRVGFGGGNALAGADDGADVVVVVGFLGCSAVWAAGHGRGAAGGLVGVGAEVADELGLEGGAGEQQLADGQCDEGAGEG